MIRTLSRWLDMANFEPTRSFPTPPAATEPEESRSTATGQRTVSHQLGAPAPPLLVKLNDSSTANRSKSTRYEIRRPLGSGAFGLVNLAWDHQLQREVAIKAPRPGLPESARQSFLQEAQLVARLRHPSVVVVHDVQVNEAGDPFIVYEYLPGKNLRQKLQSGQSLPLDEALSLALAIAEGLAAAHKLGLTHRDLKPANILLDADGSPRIADFGLAIQEGRQSQLKGEVAGTNKYMAPEQVRGDAHHLDGRADLWALGVILYEMLTGRHPFLAEKGEDILDQILHRPPRPPRQWNPAVPKPVEEIVLRLLAKSPEQRYGSASELIPILRGELHPVASKTPEPKSSGNGRRTLLLAAGAAGATLAAGVIPAWFNRRKSPTYLDHDYPPGVWVDLLSRERQYGKILSSSFKSIWSEDGRELHLSTDYPVLLELGSCVLPKYSLEITFDSDPWNDGAGLFWGYSPSEKAGLDHLTMLNVQSTAPAEGGKRTAEAVFRCAHIESTGEQHFTAFESPGAFRPSMPTSTKAPITLRVDIRDGQAQSVYLNHNPVALQNPLFRVPFPHQGRLGIFLEYRSADFKSVKIRVSTSKEQR